MKPGAMTELVVRENPSTGYIWYEDKLECLDVIDIQSVYKPPSEEET